MSLKSNIEITTNVAVIVVAALLSVALVRVYLLPAAPPPRTVPGSNAPAAIEASVGTSLKGRLPGVDWGKNRKTLVLAISSTCHFCKDSEPFYRRLQQEAGKGMKIVAVLPQSVTEAQQYLNSAGLHVDTIKQVSPRDLGVRGTPTMLLVNGSGVVTKVWTGKIQPGEQDQVLSALLNAHS